jgi:FlaG/FlaF family flagellin (archaellin)
MRNIITVAVTCLILAATAAAWVATSTTQARVATPAGNPLDQLQMMTSARNLPTEEFVDYTFVFE